MNQSFVSLTQAIVPVGMTWALKFLE